MQLQSIPKLKHRNSTQFFLLAGPCTIEGETMAIQIAEHMWELTNKDEISFLLNRSVYQYQRNRHDIFARISAETEVQMLDK